MSGINRFPNGLFSFPSFQPSLHLFRQAHEPAGQKDDCKDKHDPDDDVPSEGKPGRFQPLPDNGKCDGADYRTGKRAQSPENDVGNRPERVVYAVEFRCKVADVVDLECSCNTREIGREGKSEEPVPDGSIPAARASSSFSRIARNARPIRVFMMYQIAATEAMVMTRTE